MLERKKKHRPVMLSCPSGPRWLDLTSRSPIIRANTFLLHHSEATRAYFALINQYQLLYLLFMLHFTLTFMNRLDKCTWQPVCTVTEHSGKYLGVHYFYYTLNKPSVVTSCIFALFREDCVFVCTSIVGNGTLLLLINTWLANVH